MPKNDILKEKKNETVVHAAVTWYLAAQRRGTHSSLTRAEVSGGGKKPWRQKGTGRARAGSTRSPLWRKGGVIFGPKPRDYNYAFPKKMRKKALKVVLSDKSREGKLKMVEELKIQDAKTKLAAAALKGLGVAGKILLILDDENKLFHKAARNIEKTKPIYVNDLNILDLLRAEWIVVEKKAMQKLQEVLA